jgi:PHD/YefM family antitoxin component YafN of YafNO toxin-antitoxin module
MAKIITTSQLQKTIGQLLAYVSQSWVVVTNKGRPTAIMLPYFDDNEDAVAEYLEEYEMNKNRAVLQARLKESLESGLSDLVI